MQNIVAQIAIIPSTSKFISNPSSVYSMKPAIIVPKVPDSICIDEFTLKNWPLCSFVNRELIRAMPETCLPVDNIKNKVVDVKANIFESKG